MKAARISGTENYAEEAPELLKRYESISFADAHGPVLHLIPPAPCHVLDIGAGTGRDAAGFATLGHSVVAVEPTEEPRRGAMLLHSSPMIEWLDDSLPNLAAVRARSEARLFTNVAIQSALSERPSPPVATCKNLPSRAQKSSFPRGPAAATGGHPPLGHAP